MLTLFQRHLSDFNLLENTYGRSLDRPLFLFSLPSIPYVFLTNREYSYTSEIDA